MHHCVLSFLTAFSSDDSMTFPCRLSCWWSSRISFRSFPFVLNRSGLASCVFAWRRCVRNRNRLWRSYLHEVVLTVFVFSSVYSYTTMEVYTIDGMSSFSPLSIILRLYNARILSVCGDDIMILELMNTLIPFPSVGLQNVHRLWLSTHTYNCSHNCKYVF